MRNGDRVELVYDLEDRSILVAGDRGTVVSLSTHTRTYVQFDRMAHPIYVWVSDLRVITVIDQLAELA